MQINQEDYENCPPNPDALIYSLRAVGYDLSMALADLIDNSIFAGSSEIKIHYYWNDGDPCIRVTDNGCGMAEATLVSAMRIGNVSPTDDRDPRDLGRYGLGLKTSSFSQCKFLAVATMHDGSKSVRFWDLDVVSETKEWKLGKSLPVANWTRLYEPLEGKEKGTVILWKNLDRVLCGIELDERTIIEEEFYALFDDVIKYIEMVFHQFLDRSSESMNVSISIGEHECIAWDPFMSETPATQIISEPSPEPNVEVTSYILPHKSKQTTVQQDEGGGLKGWNSQQGFYVYRNARMIISGGYLNLGLKLDEHYKLARMKIEISNDMDQDWSLDIKKAVAIPPHRLKKKLHRIATATRNLAKERYSVRTGRPRSSSIPRRNNVHDIWIQKKIREKVTYNINQDSLVLQEMMKEVSLDSKWLHRFFQVIESTLPHSLIVFDGLDNEGCQTDLPDDIYPPANLMEVCKRMYENEISAGKTAGQAADIVCSCEPFSQHPAYRAHLEQ